MEKMEEALQHILDKAIEADNADDACKWTQAANNLICISHSGHEMLKEMTKADTA